MNRMLRPEQVDRYWQDGILFPLPALTADEVAYYRARVEELEVALGGHVPKLGIVQPQLHFRWAYDLATHPGVVQAVTEVIGPDVLVQSAGVFDKHPGDGQYVAWHQDGYYWHLSARGWSRPGLRSAPARRRAAAFGSSRARTTATCPIASGRPTGTCWPRG